MKIIYYYHIPKCGGTTISRQLRELAATLDGEYHEFDSEIRQGKCSLPLRVLNNFKLRKFLKTINTKTRDFKFVHHHHGFYGIGEIHDLLKEQKEKAESEGNEFYLFTCVRDPISFQISRVNYLRNSCGFPDFSFKDACQNPKDQNIMYKYLLYNHPCRWRANLDLSKQNFDRSIGLMDKVFVLERLDALYDWLQGIVGVPVKSKEKKVNVGKHKIMPTEEQLEILKRVNDLDQVLYDYAKESGF